VLVAAGAALSVLIGAARPRRAAAQPARARIGYLVQSPLIDPPSEERAAFLDEMSRLGYVAGRNLEIVYRSAENEPEFFPDLVRDLVDAKVDIIVAAGAGGASAALLAGVSIPIVFTQHPDPIGAGLVRSLAHPGGNITGVSFVAPDLAGKRLGLLREMLPGAKRVTMIWASPDLATEVSASVKAAQRAGIALDRQRLARADGLAAQLERIGQSRPDALLVLADLKMVSYRDLVLEMANRHRLPTMAGWYDLVRAGGLISYSPNFADLFRRAAHQVDKILRGAKPADLPVEQPTQFHLAVNLRTASALGLSIPRSILLRADEVIQ